MICAHSQESTGKSVESFFKSSWNQVSPTLIFMTSFLSGSGAAPPHEYQISAEANISDTPQSPRVIVPIGIPWPGLVTHLSWPPTACQPVMDNLERRFCSQVGLISLFHSDSSSYVSSPVYSSLHLGIGCRVVGMCFYWAGQKFIRVFCSILQKNTNELFGHPNTHPYAVVTGLAHSSAGHRSGGARSWLQN